MNVSVPSVNLRWHPTSSKVQKEEACRATLKCASDSAFLLTPTPPKREELELASCRMSETYIVFSLSAESVHRGRNDDLINQEERPDKWQSIKDR